MQDRWDPLASIVCPYDDTHVISVKRFQRHLVKCRANHPEKDFVTCPFNARHMFLRPELRNHLATCVDRVTLDPDVVQEENPETGEMLRLKGKTDMPKPPPDDIAEGPDDWDDEIEENLAMKYAYQEESLKLQGFLNPPVEEKPLLRRPDLSSDRPPTQPNLPLVNKPAGFLTSLRRPNLETAEGKSTNGIETPSLNSSVESSKRDTIVTGLSRTQINGDHVKGQEHVDDDSESLVSEMSWTSSVYEPLKPYSNKSALRSSCKNDAQERLTTTATVEGPRRFMGGVSAGTVPSISRGRLVQSLQASAFTKVPPRAAGTFNDEPSKAPLGRGLFHPRFKQSATNSEVGKGIGRGSLKMAALNIQTPMPPK